MKEGALWLAIIILSCFLGPLNRDRYQATAIGKQAFVIDKHTGEAWVSIANHDLLNKSKMELVPVDYENYGQWSFRNYKPEDSRNDSNADWSTWTSRKWSQTTKAKDDYWDQFEKISD